MFKCGIHRIPIFCSPSLCSDSCALGIACSRPDRHCLQGEGGSCPTGVQNFGAGSSRWACAVFVQTQLSDPADAKQFARWLWTALPLRADQVYNMAAPLPTVDMNRRGDTLPSKIHIAMLGFMPCCTLKPPPSAHTSLEAAEHFLTCGFLTNEKPLLAKHLHQEDHLSVEVPWKQEATGMPGHAASVHSSCPFAHILDRWRQCCFAGNLSSVP